MTILERVDFRLPKQLLWAPRTVFYWPFLVGCRKYRWHLHSLFWSVLPERFITHLGWHQDFLKRGKSGTELLLVGGKREYNPSFRWWLQHPAGSQMFCMTRGVGHIPFSFDFLGIPLSFIAAGTVCWEHQTSDNASTELQHGSLESNPASAQDGIELYISQAFACRFHFQFHPQHKNKKWSCWMKQV